MLPVAELFPPWLSREGWGPADFMDEGALFAYLTEMVTARVGGTAGAALSAALNFAGGVFEAKVAAPTCSPRVRGLVATLLRRRHLRTRPCDQVAVDHVIKSAIFGLDHVIKSELIR